MLTKLEQLNNILQEWEPKKEEPKIDEPVVDAEDTPEIDVLYYENNKTQAVFISVDGGKLVAGPTGKFVPYAEELYTEVDAEEAESELTQVQKDLITSAAKADYAKRNDKYVQPKGGRSSYKPETELYMGMNVTASNKRDLESGKSVAVVAFGRRYFILDTSKYDPKAADFKAKVTKDAQDELTKRLQDRGQGRTSYRLVSPFIK